MSPPVSTYRLQLTKEFGFAQVTERLAYFENLGVDALYLSPILAAEPGSTHGYDVIDPGLVNPELGGEDEFIRLATEAKKRRLQVVVDFVPNHMGIASHANRLWNDLLENGPSALAAEVFDVDWDTGKILLPILGDNYGKVLEEGHLKLLREGGNIVLSVYGSRQLPMAPRPLAPLLERAAAKVTGDGHTELLSIATGLRNLPDREETADERREERAREKEVAKKRLAAICETAEVAAAIDGEIAALNTPDALHELLEQQVYRLSNWRVALESINYRRFFDVDHLAAVRMEVPKVFERCHAKIFELIDKGLIQGLRLDHIDGLYDPTDYLHQLRARVGEDFYIIVEKILEPGETLPPEWPVQGTTGYEFAAANVFLDQSAEEQLTTFYQRFTRNDMPWEDRAVLSKRLILRTSLASELQMLGRRLKAIAESQRKHRDLTLGALVHALTETIACFPVYRTYIRPDGSRQPQDDKYIMHAIGAARKRNRSASAESFNFLADTLCSREPNTAFVMRFQQLTGPAMAKAIEDTAFYVHNRFVALNEVGGDPDHFGTSVKEFHAANLQRLKTHPYCMTTTSTHDTKRGEDARARLAVLTEKPEEWTRAVLRWSKLAKSYGVDPNDEYLFYQAAVGALPFSGEVAGLVDRLVPYMFKAAKEAKAHTSWINPNDEYEKSLEAFVRGMLGDSAFTTDLIAFCDGIKERAVANALGQVVLKLCSPGVPDIYQGSEKWNQSLVDPDNRRAPAFDESKDVKTQVTRQLFQLRRQEPELFLQGSYTPLDFGDQLIAFKRADRLTVVVTRQPGAQLPRLAGRDVLNAGKLPVAVFLA